MNKLLLISLITLCCFSSMAQKSKGNLINNPSFEKSQPSKLNKGGWKFKKAPKWQAVVSVVTDKSFITDGKQSISCKINAKGGKDRFQQVAVGRILNAQLFDVTKDYELKFDLGTDGEAKYEVFIACNSKSSKSKKILVSLKDQKSMPGKMSPMVFKLEISKLGIDSSDLKNVALWIRMGSGSNAGKTFYFDNFNLYAI
ncbi:hypothetical protein [Halosquirtibacter laminarini]|uniref:hypothetical protein n=1 Tax=Halosquirtibacter laminarini TaxID=3374600 RepID=UPI003749A416